MPFLTAEIFEGAEGHLFLATGSNNVVSLFSQGGVERERLVQAWTDLLVGRGTRLAESGVKYFHCFVPDKLSIYRAEAGRLWDGLSAPAESIEARQDSKLRPYLVPLTAYFLRQKQRHLLFFRNDTHWTIEGCFSAYQMLCAYLGLTQRGDLINAPAATMELAGDLGGKLDPPRSEMLRFGAFGRSAVRVYANRLVLLRESGELVNSVSLHVGSTVGFANVGAKCKKRVLIFGDSFSEYRTHLLTGLLADTVSEVMFVWSANIDFGIVESFAPDIVVTEIAERFMGRVPTDDVDLVAHAERKVAEAIKARALPV